MFAFCSSGAWLVGIIALVQAVDHKKTSLIIQSQNTKMLKVIWFYLGISSWMKNVTAYMLHTYMYIIYCTVRLKDIYVSGKYVCMHSEMFTYVWQWTKIRLHLYYMYTYIYIASLERFA